jgi:CelD/BcsL family acetyltransferase involved in cellulose biosynthesis
LAQIDHRIVIRVRAHPIDDFNALGQRWRDLEQRADCSFFQTWTWLGCLASERYPDPILVEATEDGRTVALALFNRVRRRFGPSCLHLAETGRTELDSPYIEQSGILAETGRAEALTLACLSAVAHRHLILSGIGPQTLGALRRAAPLVCIRRTQASPCIDLTQSRDYLETRSANTRQQIRRSDRHYQRSGPISTERAATLPAALQMLEELQRLHQASWTARGQPGSFAAPFFLRFHRALIAAALPRQEATLLRISCGSQTIGILYSFSFRNRMHAYQSGFDYQPGRGPAKPGLTCHHAAINLACAEGFAVYDFLAGDDRYKRSLSDHAHTQYWAEAGPIWSPRLLRLTARSWAQPFVPIP